MAPPYLVRRGARAALIHLSRARSNRWNNSQPAACKPPLYDGIPRSTRLGRGTARRTIVAGTLGSAPSSESIGTGWLVMSGRNLVCRSGGGPRDRNPDSRRTSVVRLPLVIERSARSARSAGATGNRSPRARCWTGIWRPGGKTIHRGVTLPVAVLDHEV